MGKHERQQIEKAEKIIIKILNSQKISSSDRKNHWFEHAVVTAKRIQKDFSNIKTAKHLGNRYDNTGDILILLNKERFFLEIKMSDTELGIGTAANISQDALTENHFFIGKVKSWSEFRKDKGHDYWVNEALNLFTKYPKIIFKIKNSVLRKESKARYLRVLKLSGNKKAQDILNIIHEKDKKEKIEYLNYLSKQKQKEEVVKRFLILIILGIHRKEILNILMKNDNLFKEAQNLFIYYSNIFKNRITIRRVDAGKKVKNILKNLSEFKIVFPRGVTHCKIVGKQNNDYKPILQIVFHWKNIAQGIKTPCLNIFDMSETF